MLTYDDGKFEFAPAEEGEWRVQAENAPEYDYALHRPITRTPDVSGHRGHADGILPGGERVTVELRLN